MQSRVLRGFLLFFLCLSLGLMMSGGEVKAAFDVDCRQAGYDCGSFYPNCWNVYCKSSCRYGCSSYSCYGGTCRPPPPTYNCDRWGMCGGRVTDLRDCYEPFCGCPCGCYSTSCSGGSCRPCTTPTPTPTPTPPTGCTPNSTKCENDVYSVCNTARVWVENQVCGYGCDGGVCRQTAYCEVTDCSKCSITTESPTREYGFQCWHDSTMDPNERIPSDGSTQYETDAYFCNLYCEVGECKVVSETCGGTRSCTRPEVSHIDNCGGLSCGPICTPAGGGGCVPGYPTKPELSSPLDGGAGDESVDLSWSVSANYGTGCPQNNSQTLYLEAGDSSPDVVLSELGSTTTTYLVSGLEMGETYYWRVLANNGSLSMSSDTFSFSIDGEIEGYMFDSGGMSVCPADLSDPAYESLKLAGGSLDIVSGAQTYLGVTTDASGHYSQLVESPGSYVLENYLPGGEYITTPDLICDGTSVEFVSGGSGSATRSFGFLQDYGGWWQAEGGDVYGKTGIESEIPRSCTVAGGCQPYLIRSDGNGESGLLTYLFGGMELGGNEAAFVSADGWMVNSGYTGQDTNYAYYISKMALMEKTSWAGNGKPVFNPEIGDDFEIYMSSNNSEINFDVASNEKMVFLVDGDVTVSADIDVSVGGHLAVIASGEIAFESDVVQVEGWWVGDTLVIASTGDEDTDLVFRGEGSFIGWKGVSLDRDRGRGNDTQPTEEFIFRPDLMVNAPDALKFSRYIWQEKAP